MSGCLWKKYIFGSFRPVDGYRVFHRERRTDRYAAFQVRTLPKAVTDLIIGNLEEDLEYEVYTHLHKTVCCNSYSFPYPFQSTAIVFQIFVQPFFGEIVGLPSPLKSARTHPSRPASAPDSVQAALVNNTKVQVTWTSLPEKLHNGPLLGYKVQKALETNSNNPTSPQRKSAVVERASSAHLFFSAAMMYGAIGNIYGV